MIRGNCYVTCEALFHLLGGKTAGWKPMTMKHEGVQHWYLTNTRFYDHVSKSHVILDPTRVQFATRPDYSKGRGCGFLTKQPSKRALALMPKLVWQGLDDAA
jgi:hypothetical protein